MNVPYNGYYHKCKQLKIKIIKIFQGALTQNFPPYCYMISTGAEVVALVAAAMGTVNVLCSVKCVRFHLYHRR